MDCIVMRQFPGAEGKMYQPGEHVDTSDWHNRDALIQGRYLQPAFMSSGFEKSSKRATSEEPFKPSGKAAREALKVKGKKRRIVEEGEE